MSASRTITKKTRSSVWPGVIAFVIATAYLIALMAWRPTGLIQEKISERV